MEFTVENITLRLSSLGYTVTQEDNWVLEFIISKVETDIKSKCNQLSIPIGLENIAIDMVCGEFLLGKKSRNQLSEFDLSKIVKSIQIGDTNTTLNDTTETRVNELISSLLNSDFNFGSYRRLNW